MSYKMISRTELEGWLDDGGYSWTRSGQTAGVYNIRLSDEVAIKISSTIGSRDDAMGRGRASMNMMLVSLVNGRCLNRKARDRKHFKRTTGWKSTWTEGIIHWEGVFSKCPHFYNRIAHEKPARW